MKKYLLSLCALWITLGVTAQKFATKITPEEYIATYSQLAMEEMKRTGVPASIKLAQGLHETESGNSDLVTRSNNHFGIKCKTGWTGESVRHDDDALAECFRKYPSAQDSYRDHSDFLKRSSRYAFLFEFKPTDYKNWAFGLKKAGYATNPKYPLILIKLIEQYNLQAYTLLALSPDSGSKESELTAKPTSVETAVTEVAGLPKMAEENAETVASTLTEDIKPGGSSMFNGLKATWAKKGTSLLAIAQKNNLHIGRLMEYNDLSREGILTADEWIYLEKKRKTGRMESVVLTQNETPRSIAQAFAIQLSYLLQYNSFDAHKSLPAGTRVQLKPAGKADQALNLVEKP